jgi:hypothetical protein
MKWIIDLIGRQLWAVLLMCLLVVALTLAGVGQALAMRNFLDFAAVGDKAGFLRWFGVYFGLIFFSCWAGVSAICCSNPFPTEYITVFACDSSEPF